MLFGMKGAMAIMVRKVLKCLRTKTRMQFPGTIKSRFFPLTRQNMNAGRW